jgi:hypothetical protein
MTAQDPNFAAWARDWQAGAPATDASAERIRKYVKRRGVVVRSLRAADFVVGAIALPVLIYFAWIADDSVGRVAMIGLAAITVAAMGLSWWNWRGTATRAATTTAEYVAISAERLRRLRRGLSIAWIVLAAEVAVFTVWIWNRLYTGESAPDAQVAQFSWAWLAGFTFVAVVSLLWFGRWMARDAERFEALRQELE